MLLCRGKYVTLKMVMWLVLFKSVVLFCMLYMQTIVAVVGPNIGRNMTETLTRHLPSVVLK